MDEAPAKRSVHAVLGMVFLVAFLDMVGFSVIFPLFPEMMRHYLDLEGDASAIGRLVASLRDIVGEGPGADWAVATLFGGVLGSIYSFLQFLFAPVWGGLSDRHGRRTILLVTLTGTVLSYVVWAWAGAFLVLVFARLLGGLCAGNISTASAVVGDTTSGKDRAMGMGMMGMGIGLGFIVGPAIGGASHALLQWDVSATGAALELNPFSAPALCALVLSVVNLVWVAARFPETLPVEKRGQHRGGHSLHPFATVKRLAVPGVRLTTWIYFVYFFGFAAMEFTLTFLTAQRLQFSTADQAWMFVYVGLLIALTQGGLVRRLAPRLGERRLGLFGMLFTLPGFLIVGGCQTTPVLYLGLFFLGVGSGFVMPSLSSLVSRYSPAESQGLALGSFRSAGSLARALGPAIGGVLYWRLGSGSPYWTAAALLLVPLLLARGLPPTPQDGDD
jgi:MFS family permease